MLPLSSVWIYTCNSTESFILSMWPNHRNEDILAKRHINASKKLHLFRIFNQFQNQYTGQAFIMLKHCNEQAILPEHIKHSKSGIWKLWKLPEIFSVKVICVFPTKDIKCANNMMMSYQCHILFNSLWPLKCPSISNTYKTSATIITFLCIVTKIQNCRTVKTFSLVKIICLIL